MGLKSRVGALVRRSGAAGVIVGGVESKVADHAGRLAHHDQALADITAALQEVQGPRFQVLEDDLRQLRSELDARIALVEHHLPAVLNTISSSAGTFRKLERDSTRVSEDHARQIGEIWERIEMVRAEALYELRYGGSASGAALPESVVEIRVVDHEKVEAARADQLRLNLGCGHLALDGYINVDMRELPGVDVVAPVGDLPFADGEVDEVFSSHVLEHFPQEQLTRQLLPYWFRLLRPRGQFRAIVPDLEAMARGLARGEIAYEDFREVTYGGQEYEGDFHFNMFSPASLTAMLADAGFVEVEIEAEGRQNGKALEFQIVARTPA